MKQDSNPVIEIYQGNAFGPPGTNEAENGLGQGLWLKVNGKWHRIRSCNSWGVLMQMLWGYLKLEQIKLFEDE